MLGGHLAITHTRASTNIGFAAAVGPDDPGDALVEVNDRAVFERLKSDEF